MKVLFFTVSVALFFLFSLNGIKAQKVNTSDQQSTSNSYLQKSKTQRTTGWILLGTGTVMATAGLIGFDKTWDSDSATATDIFGFVFLAGFVADIVSIPFFIGAGVNKRRALSVSLNYQNIYFQPVNSFPLKLQPALTLRVNI